MIEDLKQVRDALDRMYNDALASQDGYGTSHDDFETIRDAITAQPDVNAELLEALKYAHFMMQPFCDDTIVKQAIARAKKEGA